MNLPAIGEIVYGFQHDQDRPGETMFLCSSQANCTPDKDDGLSEALAEVCRTGEMELIEGEWIETINTDDTQHLVVWEMKRIR